MSATIFDKIEHAESCELGCRIIPRDNMNEVQLLPACRKALDAAADAANEAAYERMYSTDAESFQERHEAAHAEKRRLG